MNLTHNKRYELKQKSTTYTEKLILPILDCFNDSDSRVRYFGCEVCLCLDFHKQLHCPSQSLYNVVKVSKEGSLVHFNALFDALAKLAADVDQNVRSGADLLDKLVKDIVSNSKSFDASELMVLIRERIHTRSSPTRRFLVGWVRSCQLVSLRNRLCISVDEQSIVCTAHRHASFPARDSRRTPPNARRSDAACARAVSIEIFCDLTHLTYA